MEFACNYRGRTVEARWLQICTGSFRLHKDFKVILIYMEWPRLRNETKQLQKQTNKQKAQQQQLKYFLKISDSEFSAAQENLHYKFQAGIILVMISRIQTIQCAKQNFIVNRNTDPRNTRTSDSSPTRYKTSTPHVIVHPAMCSSGGIWKPCVWDPWCPHQAIAHQVILHLHLSLKVGIQWVWIILLKLKITESPLWAFAQKNELKKAVQETYL